MQAGLAGWRRSGGWRADRPRFLTLPCLWKTEYLFNLHLPLRRSGFRLTLQEGRCYGQEPPSGKESSILDVLRKRLMLNDLRRADSCKHVPGFLKCGKMRAGTWSLALQKAVPCHAKGRLSHGKRPSIALQVVAFCSLNGKNKPFHRCFSSSALLVCQIVLSCFFTFQNACLCGMTVFLCISTSLRRRARPRSPPFTFT